MNKDPDKMILPTLKEAQCEDMELLLPLIEAYYGFDGIPFESTHIRGSLDVLLRNRSLGRVWIIRLEEQRIGYVILTFGYDLEFGGSVATITDLFLVAAQRRRGVGRRLLQFLETTCRDLGIAALELQVERDNREARAFYKSLGFAVHERIPLSKRLRNTTE